MIFIFQVFVKDKMLGDDILDDGERFPVTLLQKISLLEF